MVSKQANTKLALRITGGVFRFVLNVLFYVIVVMCIFAVSKKAYDFTYQVFGEVRAEENEGRDMKIRIVRGDSTMEIGQKLEQSKLILDKNAFFIKAKINGIDIMPGTYALNSSMSYDEILAYISDVNNSLTSDEYLEKEE